MTGHHEQAPGGGRRGGRRDTIIVALLLAAGGLMLATYARGGGSLSPGPTPTRTREPIVPTRTPAAQAAAAEPPTPSPARPFTPTPSRPAPPATPPSPPVLPPIREHERYGIGVERRFPDLLPTAHAAGLRFGSWLDWTVRPDAAAPDGVRYWYMLRVSEAGIWPDEAIIEAALAARPGAVWLIGNEPDVRWQDNTRPERYAVLYHEAHSFIKARDPSALVAIAGVAQPTPLRRRYLDVVLDTYAATYGRPMPIDIWNVHAFILREERDSWGVDIPPGLSETGAILYEIDDHDDLAIFQQNLIDFRNWMAARGYGGWPLVVSEYGLLHPSDYGFPAARVTAFLTGTFDFMRTAVHPAGYAPEDGRLVQWWFWYILYDDFNYPTGNLFDPQTGELTAVGRAYSDYVRRHAPGAP